MSKAKVAPPINPFTEIDLANAQQIIDVADQLIPLLSKGQRCGLVQCNTYLQQVQAQREFAAGILREFASGNASV